MALPRLVTERLAQAAGDIAHRVARGERTLAMAQLQQAFPDQTPAACQKWTRQMFRHLAMCIAELAHVDTWLTSAEGVVFDPGARAILDAALAEGKGVVLVAGHIGNWELMAQALAHAGYPLCTIAKPLYDPRLTRWVHRERVRHGMQVIWRGDPLSARRMLQVFRRGHMLGVLIDQDTTRDTAFVSFFGRPAATPTAAATLALRFGAPTVVIWSHRANAGSKTQHRITCRRLPNTATSAPHDDVDARRVAVSALTERMSRCLEDAIRVAPSQWVWLHRRWRRQPIVP